MRVLIDTCVWSQVLRLKSPSVELAALLEDLIRDSRVDGMWVHMYGYLSDRKLQILKEIWS